MDIIDELVNTFASADDSQLNLLYVFSDRAQLLLTLEVWVPSKSDGNSELLPWVLQKHFASGTKTIQDIVGDVEI
jgi:hypothetical protein